MAFQANAQAAQDSTGSIHSAGKIYVVVGCAVIIAIGIIFYLFRLEKKINYLEKKSSSKI